MHVKETVLPNKERAARYAQKYVHFAMLYPALKGLFIG